MESRLKLPKGLPLLAARVGSISAMASSSRASSKPSSAKVVGMPNDAKKLRVSSIAENASASTSPLVTSPKTSRP